MIFLFITTLTTLIPFISNDQTKAVLSFGLGNANLSKSEALQIAKVESKNKINEQYQKVMAAFDQIGTNPNPEDVKKDEAVAKSLKDAENELMVNLDKAHTMAESVYMNRRLDGFEGNAGNFELNTYSIQETLKSSFKGLEVVGQSKLARLD